MVTPLVYGHRGASAAAPENTLAAFDLARAQGADGVELDVRRTVDGHLVLHHDAVLADGREVASVTRAELSPSVPGLADALDVCVGVIVNIEIKNIVWEPDFDPDRAVAAEVVGLLASRGGRDTVLVSSFDLRSIDRVKAMEPSLTTGFLTFVDPLPIEGLQQAADNGHDAVHPHEATIDDAVVEAAHQAGLEVNAWTVDDPDRIRTLAGLGVDGVVTNVPDVARRVLGAPGRS